jgi:hypothetical protein
MGRDPTRFNPVTGTISCLHVHRCVCTFPRPRICFAWRHNVLHGGSTWLGFLKLSRQTANREGQIITSSECRKANSSDGLERRGRELTWRGCSPRTGRGSGREGAGPARSRLCGWGRLRAAQVQGLAPRHSAATSLTRGKGNPCPVGHSGPRESPCLNSIYYRFQQSYFTLW